MTRNELALKLVEAVEETKREALIRHNPALADVELGRFLKEICLDSWTSDPARAVRAAQTISFLAKHNSQPETTALAAWTEGISAMINGQLRDAVTRFDDAKEIFGNLGQYHDAASTQVAKLYPLALLGRYDEAIETGLESRVVFLKSSDFAAAGRVEHNLGNIFQRVGRYGEAEAILRSARDRFVALGDIKRLAQITNSLAYALSYQYKFGDAEAFYREALTFAEQSSLFVTQAEIESNLGYFSLYQGRYDQALELLERARIKYSTLGMPHQSAVAELEVADAYLDLNLYSEAGVIYSRVIPLFSEIGMPIEHARALTNFARVQFVLGKREPARALLEAARKIFASCQNEVGEATVLLNEAQFLFAENRFEDTIKKLAQAEIPIARAGIKGTKLLADLLRAESWRALGNLHDAQILLVEIRKEAEASEIPPLTARCLTALGLTAKAGNDLVAAEAYFKNAVALIESLRAPLPSEEFRTAFFGDKLTPYKELARICLEDQNRVVEALEYVEKARSRSLLEIMKESVWNARFEGGRTSELHAKMAQLREELNWLYNQLHRPRQENTRIGLDETKRFQKDARKRETEISEIIRQLQLEQPQGYDSGNYDFRLAALQNLIGSGTAFVEYFEIEDQFAAFVVTETEVLFFPEMCRDDEIDDLVSRLYFQLEALRSDPQALDEHSYELTLRTRHILSELYDLLLRPLEDSIGLRRIIVSPHRSLHYIPFHALYDGMAYTIETHEIGYAPSAAILQNCLERPHRKLGNALFVGVPDDRIRHVTEEVNELSAIMPGNILLADQATWPAISVAGADIDILHLACHGQFRAENPLFSSLKLFDRWCTVGDICSLRLDANLVVLSACETGLSRIAPGNELLGLARGFFSAGASSLLLSLWNVHDETTVDLMRRFYTEVRREQSPATALQVAQREILQKRPHPFFWSPFFLIGRW